MRVRPVIHTHKIARETNEIALRSDRKGREKDMAAVRRGGK